MIDNDDDSISLATLAEGAIEEKFGIEMRRVLANIQDLSTSPTAAREIAIKLRFKPNDERQSWTMEGQVSSKIAPGKGVVANGYFDLDRRRKPVAVEHKRGESIADMLDRDAKKGIQPHEATEQEELQMEVV